MQQAIAARRDLADTEEALGRLAAGRYGRCEQCAGPIPPELLADTPEIRYCPGCSARPACPPPGQPPGSGR
jgi:RNA polymerase-binding transcription factor DksA